VFHVKCVHYAKNMHENQLMSCVFMFVVYMRVSQCTSAETNT